MSGQTPTLSELDEQATGLVGAYGRYHQEPAFLIRPAVEGDSDVVVIGLLHLPPQTVATLLRAAATLYDSMTPPSAPH
ncbi:hypothetical protein LC55x_1645 [Lysobacter capsici]|uniref:hypothetical protein n=1 Tax=Lysobacter capsici TaxID=435897 RepID=UPI0007164431|nr:hypothetical protein [Lysobacter capsici]ALN84935.1 hypothetical protein LC55x_1645 [Lysobacter capsici]